MRSKQYVCAQVPHNTRKICCGLLFPSTYGSSFLLQLPWGGLPHALPLLPCRDVFLLAKPLTFIADFFVNTPLSFVGSTSKLQSAR